MLCNLTFEFCMIILSSIHCLAERWQDTDGVGTGRVYCMGTRTHSPLLVGTTMVDRQLSNYFGCRFSQLRLLADISQHDPTNVGCWCWLVWQGSDRKASHDSPMWRHVINHHCWLSEHMTWFWRHLSGHVGSCLPLCKGYAVVSANITRFKQTQPNIVSPQGDPIAFKGIECHLFSFLSAVRPLWQLVRCQPSKRANTDSWQSGYYWLMFFGLYRKVGLPVTLIQKS